MSDNTTAYTTSVILGLMLPLAWAVHTIATAAPERVSADILQCTSPSSAINAGSDSCARTTVIATLAVTVTPAAAACARMTQVPVGGASVIKAGRLAYIDKDNWQCRVSEGKDSARIMEMTDGTLAEQDVYAGNTVPSNALAIDRRDTALGWVRHYLRKARDLGRHQAESGSAGK